jgi:plastocyanin
MSSNIRRSAIAVLTVVALIALALAVAGCAASGPQGSMTPRTMPSAGAPASQRTWAYSAGSTSATSGVQTCAQCGGKGAPSSVVGQAVTQGGVQVVNVGLVNGYYSPNAFTVKAGMPVRVVFSGKATGCLAHPQFASLGKKGDLTSTGGATIDLGALKPGVYKFTCAMGMNAGTITVQ